jgi:hypothetical protein
METRQAITSRRNVRTFDGRPIPAADLDQILEFHRAQLGLGQATMVMLLAAAVRRRRWGRGPGGPR